MTTLGLPTWSLQEILELGVVLQAGGNKNAVLDERLTPGVILAATVISCGTSLGTWKILKYRL
jgi:hypothetical protein